MTSDRVLRRRTMSALVSLGLALSEMSCAPAPRPVNVPAQAVRIPGVKGKDFWQYCRMQDSAGTYCQIFNVNGEVLYEDTFVPYLGSAPKDAADLKIVPRGGAESIALENGTILIPQGQFAHVKSFLDWQRGSSPRP